MIYVTNLNLYSVNQMIKSNIFQLLMSNYWDKSWIGFAQYSIFAD